jgi:hypothetical protein
MRELIEHGYDVTNDDDLAPSRDDRRPLVRADLADFGQTLEVLAGVDEHPAADASCTSRRSRRRGSFPTRRSSEPTR